MARTFQFSIDDLTALMALMPAPVFDNRRRRGFAYDGKTLTVQDDGEAARLQTILADPRWRDRALMTQLKGYAAHARYQKEIAGITVNGIPVATDRDGQMRAMAAQVMATADPTMVFHWKKADGSFAQLTADQVVAIGKAVVMHVQACFGAEASIHAALSANPALMTQARIDAMFAAIRV